MANLSPTELKALHSAIQQAFTRDELRRVLKFSLNVDLDGEIAAANTTLSETVFALLQWSQRMGRGRELIQAIVEERKGNPAVAAFAPWARSGHDVPPQNKPVEAPLRQPEAGATTNTPGLADPLTVSRPPEPSVGPKKTGKLHVFIS